MSLSKIIGPKPRPKIFICYRRSGESAGYGGRMASKLVEYFGRNQCFRDIENIEKGTDFVESIKHATGICELLLVVIGPDWLTLKDEFNKPKIFNKNDFVRIEVATALERNIRVIPVLVGRAKVPSEDELPDDLKSLVRRQSLELTDERWEYDSDQLIKAIEAIGIKGRSPQEREAVKRKQKIVLAVILTALVVVIGMVSWMQFSNKLQEDHSKTDAVQISKEPRTSVEQNLSSGSAAITEQETTNEKVTKTDFKSSPERTITHRQTDNASASEQAAFNKTPEARTINYEREKGSIKTAVMLASSLEATALWSLDDTELSQVFSGDALRNLRAVISQYRKEGIMDINTLESQEFGDFNIYNEDNNLFANVDLYEVWSTHTDRSSDNLCLRHMESHDTPQTVYLEKKEDSWQVVSISFHNNSTPLYTACLQYSCLLH